MKSLKDFTKGYRPKSKDEQRFVDKHHVVKHPDRNGNKDDVFKATNVKMVDREMEHGYNPGSDEKVYEAIKPYVSMSKGTAEVLDSDGKSRAKFSKSEHGIDYKKMAMAHLNKHYSDYYKESNDAPSTRRMLDAKAKWAAYPTPSNERAYKKEKAAHKKRIAAFKTNEEIEISEGTKRLDKVNIVHHHDTPEAKEFAKHYTKGHIGDYRSGGPQEGDEKHSDYFHNRYERTDNKSGFAGSGISVYHDTHTGNHWKVTRSPNGKTFYGTDHLISQNHGPKLSEEVELDEISTDAKQNYLDKADRWIDKKLDSKPAPMKKIDQRSRIANKVEADIRRRGLKPKGFLSKEEVESLDELSKETLRSYAVKANRKGNMAARMSNNGSKKDMSRYATKRQAGVERAINKLTKEEVIERVIERFTPESYTPKTDEDRLLENLSSLSNSHVELIVGLYESLNEDNQKRLIGLTEDENNLPEILDFALDTRK